MKDTKCWITCNLFLSEIPSASSSYCLDYHKESLQSHTKFLWTKHYVRHCRGEKITYWLSFFIRRSVQNNNTCKVRQKKIRERANKLRKFTWILDRRYNNKKIHILKALNDGKCAEWALKWALCILAAIREKILNLHWLHSKNKPFSQEKFIPEINASSRSITCAVKSCTVVNTMSS